MCRRRNIFCNWEILKIKEKYALKGFEKTLNIGKLWQKWLLEAINAKWGMQYASARTQLLDQLRLCLVIAKFFWTLDTSDNIPQLRKMSMLSARV
jgi:hypothetical protein